MTSKCSPNDCVDTLSPTSECKGEYQQIVPSYSAVPLRLSPSIQSLADIAASLGLVDEINKPLDTPVKTASTFDSKSTYRIENTTSAVKDSDLVEQFNRQTEYCAAHPMLARVASARTLSNGGENQLTLPWGEDRKVIHVELEVDPLTLPYQPGDSIGLCCPNPSYLVDLVSIFGVVPLSSMCLYILQIP